jgi:sugar lactone lactonase YvrE
MTWRTADVDVVTAPVDLLGEGLLWDPDGQRLVWVDIERRLLRSCRPRDGRLVEARVAQRPTAVVPREGGGLVVAVESGIAELDDLDGTLEMRVRLEQERPHNRLNDAKCAPDGRLFAGTMHEGDAERQAALYRIDGDYSVARVVSGVTLSNGLGWSPAGDVMYYVDTMTRGVDAFDYGLGTGELRRRRRIVTLGPEDGLPDGMTVDADGCLWVALWGGGEVRRYRPDGRLDGTIELPASQVTNCCFGGAGMNDLYITSARLGLTQEQLAAEPLAGAVFRVRVDTAGPPAAQFAVARGGAC